MTEQAFRDWLHRVHAPGQARRTAAVNAAFFLPHLASGMSLLDAGCGAGSITLGLAEAVAPGEVVGIDLNVDAIDAARALATARGITNARFEVGDACALPFEDGSFDAAFSHALLQHVESPPNAVREMRRVLRPAGVIALADADFGGSLTYPPSDGIERGGEVLRKMRPSPFVGRGLSALLSASGFERVEGWFSGGGPANQNTAAANGQFWASYFESEPFIAHAEAMGWATRREMLQIAAAWREWGHAPGAFWAAFWCQALGWVPVAG